MKNREIDPDLCRDRILNDKFLFASYSQMYSEMLIQSNYEKLKNAKWQEINSLLNSYTILEIGSAGGILKKLFPNAVTSDVRSGNGVDEYQDAQNFSKPDNSVDLILAKDCLHHLPDVEKHFSELIRILRSGGKAVYLEPNWNFISIVIFKLIHPEDWSTNKQDWQFKSNDPMEANQALAYNIFKRDAEKFKEKYPMLKFNIVEKPLNGLSFMFSGGVTMRTKIPASLLTFTAKWESKSKIWMKLFGFNRIIVISKK